MNFTYSFKPQLQLAQGFGACIVSSVPQNFFASVFAVISPFDMSSSSLIKLALDSSPRLAQGFVSVAGASLLVLFFLLILAGPA